MARTRHQWRSRSVEASPHETSSVGGVLATLRSTKAAVWLPALIFLVPLAYYWPVLQAGFISDDYFWFPYFKYSLRDMLEATLLAHRGEIELDYFRPSVVFSYQMDYAVWNDEGFGFHLTNLILHSLNAVMFFYLARIVGASRIVAGAASLFFALYPAGSEVVTWVSGRCDLLACAFLLISLLCWSAARLRSDWRWMVPSVAAFLIAVFAKEGAAAGIFLLPLMDWLLERGRLGGRAVRWHWKGYVIFAAAIAAIVAFRYWLYGDIGGHRGPSNRSNYFDIKVSRVWADFVLQDFKMLLTPVSRARWMEWPYGWRIASVVVGASCGIGLVAGLVRSIVGFRRDRFALSCIIAGILWTIVMLLPVITLPPVTDELVRSRFFYTPAAGLGLWVGMSVDLGWRSGKLWRFVSVATLITLLIVSGFALRRQNQAWLESGEIATRIDAVMAAHTAHLSDGADIIVVNYPFGYKGVPCAPVWYGVYLEFLYGYKGVKTHRVFEDPSEIPAWWDSLREHWRRPAAGFVWDESTESIRVLPPIYQAVLEGEEGIEAEPKGESTE